MSPLTDEERRREMQTLADRELKTLTDESREFCRDAAAVASGELPLVNDPNVLQAIEDYKGMSVALAAHRADDYCAVFLVMKRSDGHWRTQMVVVHDGACGSSVGGVGGIRLRSEAELGKPLGECRAALSLGTGKALVCVSGVSADKRVRLRWEDEIVAETALAEHGYFVLAAVVPHDADAGRVDPSRAVVEGC